jgi:basic membrane protein A
MVLRIDNTVAGSIDAYRAGSFTGGQATLGLAEDGVDYARNQYNGALLGNDIPPVLDDIHKKIATGEIRVPETPAD